MNSRKTSVASSVLVWLLASACTPTVEVAAPKEPIVINLNVKIEHEIRVKVDEDLDDLFNDSEELFK